MDFCPICLDTFAEPVTLPCGHSACRSCLRPLAKKSAAAGGAVELNCPSCRRLCTVPAELPVSIVLRDVLPERSAGHQREPAFTQLGLEEIAPSALQLREVLGRGPHGTVHAAAWGGRRVAAKALQASDAAAERRIAQRIAPFARLRHPSMAQMYGVCRDPARGLLYLVTEFADGGTLAESARHANPSLHETLDCATQLLAVLGHLHARNAAHGNLKSTNVLVFRGPEGASYKLCDPGGYADDGPAADQARRQPAGDVFALGTILNAMLGGPAARRPSAPSEGAPEWLRALVRAMLSPDPAGRPSAGELRAAVAAGGAPPSARPSASGSFLAAPPSPTPASPAAAFSPVIAFADDDAPPPKLTSAELRPARPPAAPAAPAPARPWFAFGCCRRPPAEALPETASTELEWVPPPPAPEAPRRVAPLAPPASDSALRAPPAASGGPSLRRTHSFLLGSGADPGVVVIRGRRYYRRTSA